MLACAVMARGGTTGYSGTPLLQKLGVRPGSLVAALHAPPHYPQLLGPLPEGATLTTRSTPRADLTHVFVTRRSVLQRALQALRARRRDDGVVWVSWPKKTSGVATEVTEDVVRAEALPLGFVDVKVCAVDEVWSGLKLVVRTELRRAPSRE